MKDSGEQSWEDPQAIQIHMSGVSASATQSLWSLIKAYAEGFVGRSGTSSRSLKKRENGEIEQVSLGCERLKIRSKGAKETLMRPCSWVLSQEGVQVCMCTVGSDRESR